jgi:hypothetical protein
MKRPEPVITVGRDAIGNIFITGDHNEVFVGDYERLRDVYIKPWSVFERIHLDRFTGRDWLTAELDAFLRDSVKGYFILEAEAGLGKTTFLAHLVKERSYVHHFVELAPGRDGIAPGLKNLAAQLIRAWQLNPYSADEVLPGAAAQPYFWRGILFEAVRQRDELKPGEKIVLVVDALDEAGTPSGQNVLGLPSVLPQGVYFIVSQRPVEVPLVVDGPRRLFRLEATSDQNLADMRAYLNRAATWDGVSRMLQDSEYSADQFEETLLEKCKGVWIYLHYVIGEIERGERSPLDLDTLPRGVWQYYAEYWQRWRGRNDWDSTSLPLLSTLAAVQEDVPLKLLCVLAGVAAQAIALRLLEETWRAFLTVSEKEARRYRLYHVSLQEFLDGRADLTDLRAQEKALTRELAEATRQAHGRIAEYYLDAWGGLRAGLPGLQESAKRDIDSQYGLRHLATHLAGAERADDLHSLLRVERHCHYDEPFTRPHWQGWLDRLRRIRRVRTHNWSENIWYLAHEHVGDTSSYLNDVNRAWRFAEETSQREIEQGKLAGGLGLETRYALLIASVNSLAGNIPPPLLAALVEKKVWSEAEGLAYARQVPNLGHRTKALAGLAPYLSGSKKKQALSEVLAAAQAIQSLHSRAQMLTELLPNLPESLREPAARQALAGLPDADGSSEGATTRKFLIPEWMLELRRGMEESELERFRDELLAELDPLKPKGMLLVKSGFLIELPDESPRALVLARLVAYLPEPLKTETLRQALESLSAIESTRVRTRVFEELSPHLPATLRQQAIEAARTIGKKPSRVVAVTKLARHFPESLMNECLREELAVLKDQFWSDLDSKVEALGILAPHLPGPLIEEALTVARSIHSPGNRADALAKLVPYLPDSLREGALTETLAVARWTRQGYAKAGDGEAFMSLMSSPQLREMFGADQASELYPRQVRLMVEVIPHLSQPLKGEVLREALERVARAIKIWAARSIALVTRVPSLSPATRDETLEQLVRVKKGLQDTCELACHLARMSSSLPESERDNALQRVLEAVGVIRLSSERARAITALAPHLPEASLQKALWIARAIRGEGARSEAMAGLAPYLAETSGLRTLREALSINDEELLAKVMTRVAPLLSAPLLQEALSATRAIRDADEQAGALAAMAPYLPESMRGDALQKVLAAARVIRNENARALVLAKLLPHLPEALRTETAQEAYAAAQRIHSVIDRLRALDELTPYLERPLLQDALKTAQDASEDSRVLVQAKLLPYLPEPDRSETLERVLAGISTLQSPVMRTQVLGELVPYLPEASRQEALAEARAIQDATDRAEALTEFGSHVPEPLKRQVLDEALAAAREIRIPDYRVRAVTRLVQHVTGLTPPVLYSIWRETLHVLASSTRKDLLQNLRALVNVIDALGGANGAEDTYHAIRDVGRWWEAAGRRSIPNEG